MMGMEAPAAASYKKDCLVARCMIRSSVTCSAIIFFEALTTDFLFCIAVVTMLNAASASSITSTMTLISGSSSNLFLSVVNKAAGALLAFFGFLMHTLLILAFSEGV